MRLRIFKYIFPVRSLDDKKKNIEMKLLIPTAGVQPQMESYGFHLLENYFSGSERRQVLPGSGLPVTSTVSSS